MIAKSKWFNRTACVLFALTLVLIVSGLRHESSDGEKLRFDEPEDQVRQSPNLERDSETMWKTVRHDYLQVSPVSAINAASRVFATLNLVGKTTNEVFELIGHNTRSSASSYKAPFFPVKTNTIVYRFDCGDFGWQFNLETDASGKVTAVERKWIY